MLHVTNGDLAADLIRSSCIEGDVLPWRDVLHIGPVPGDMSMKTLSKRRAECLSSLGCGDEEELFQNFLDRNSTLQSHLIESPVILWFEHDLYDQLQLIQILAWIAEINSVVHNCYLICIDQYPGVEPFHGLGNLHQEQITQLFGTRKLVTASLMSSSVDAWKCFTGSNPEKHQELADRINPELPFLQSAYRRFLEDWPSVFNGLGRTEAHALSLIAEGIQDPVELFRAHGANEQAPFMGDWAFWQTIRGLAGGLSPLIIVEGDQLSPGFQNVRFKITPKGSSVSRGEEDAIQLRGVDRWYGGYHATDRENVSRWDAARGRLTF